MSEKALAMRIKAIERGFFCFNCTDLAHCDHFFAAKGQFAVIKMRLFARVLCLEGMEVRCIQTM